MKLKENLTKKNLVKAILWKIFQDTDSDKLRQVWKEFSQLENFSDIVQKIATNLGNLSSIYYQMKLNYPYQNFENELIKFEETITDILAQIFTKKFEQNICVQWQKLINKEILPLVRKAIEDALDSYLEFEDEKSHNQSVKSNSVMDKSESLFQYSPLPKDGIDNHPERNHEQKIIKIIPNKSYTLMGARVRGKKHKHDGTNCDDWFETKVTENWTIIAVADGAGSKKFSRIGAKVSCQAVVNKLTNLLENIKLNPRINSDELTRDDLDIKLVLNAIAEAVIFAYKKVEKKVSILAKLTDYYKELNNRDLQLSDLASTLLIAVQTTIKIEGKNYSLVFGYQIGDGVIATISEQLNVNIVGVSQGGKFAGETVFLTSQKKLTQQHIINNVGIFLGDLKSLMVMTDGVGDDYFPAHKNLTNLYGDLMLNQIIPCPDFASNLVDSEVAKTKAKTIDSLINCQHNFSVQQRVLTEEEEKKFKVAYLEKYAQILGLTPQEITKNPVLLGLGAKYSGLKEFYEQQGQISLAQRLENWLDAYYHRASFDDRSLVVIFPST